MQYTGYTNEQLLVEFKKLVRSAKTIKACREIAKTFKSVLVDKYSSRTVSSYLTKYRQTVNEMTKDTRHKAALIEGLRMNKHTKGKIMREDEKRIVSKSVEPVLISEYNAKKIIKLAIDTLERNINNVDKFSFNECICALIVLTGRRITEIAKSGEFSAYKRIDKQHAEKLGLSTNQVNTLLDGIDNVLRFDGQLKKGNKSKNNKNIGTTIYVPVLHDRSKVIQMLSKVRSLEDQRCKEKGIKTHSELSLVQSQKRTSVVNEKTVNQLFGDLFETKITTHDLRKFYAAYTFYKYGTGKNQSALYTYILGHWNSVKSTSFKSYLNFSIVKKATKKKESKKVVSKNKKSLLISDSSTNTITEFNELKQELCTQLGIELSSADVLKKLLLAYKAKTTGMTKRKQVELKLEDIIANRSHKITSYTMRKCTYIEGGKFSSLIVQDVIKQNKQRIDEYNQKYFSRK